MIVPTVSQALLLLLLGGVFVHFVIAGGRTFYSEDLQNEPGALVGQLSFYVTGMMLIWYLGLHQAIPWINGIAAALLLVLPWRCTSGRGTRSGFAGSAWAGATTCPTRSASRDPTDGCGILST